MSEGHVQRLSDGDDRLNKFIDSIVKEHVTFHKQTNSIHFSHFIEAASKEWWVLASVLFLRAFHSARGLPPHGGGGRLGWHQVARTLALLLESTTTSLTRDNQSILPSRQTMFGSPDSNGRKC